MSGLAALDIRTLLLLVALLRLVQALVLVLVWRSHRNYPPSAYWAWGAGLSSLGLLLLGLRDQLPLLVSVLVGNLLALLGDLVFNAGMLVAARRRAPWRLGLGAWALAGGLLLWFATAQPSAGLRVQVYSGASLIFSSFALWAAWLAPTGRERQTLRWMALALLPYLAALLWRAATVGPSSAGLLDSSPQLSLLLLVSSCELLAMTALVGLLASQWLQQRIEQLASVDPLTGLLNRRSFQEAVDHEWRRSLRHGHALACLLVDIDHFKQINDRYGHAAGDQALQAAAALLRRQLRDADLSCRWGGEEFVCLLPETDEAAACAVAERLRAAVLAEARGTAAPRAASVSIGVAALRVDGGADWDRLLQAADRAMYAAKQGGRNRVRVERAGAAT